MINVPRYIDADELLFRLREYRKLTMDDFKDVSAKSYRDMNIADISMTAFYAKSRDLFNDLMEASTYEGRIEVIDRMITYIEETIGNPENGDYRARSF